jgi:hypothetical protein
VNLREKYSLLGIEVDDISSDDASGSGLDLTKLYHVSGIEMCSTVTYDNSLHLFGNEIESISRDISSNLQ